MMRMTGSRAYARPTSVPKMPTGLGELIEGMTKEVLRCNPTDIYEFCAAHMKKLLEIRDGATTKQALTLEQKISRAQDIIKQRARERRQRFDNDMQWLHKISHKKEEPPLQITQTTVTRENLTTVEEIEISHCENNEAIEKSIDLITKNNTEKTSRSGDVIINQFINESENCKTILQFNNTVENQHIAVFGTDHNGATECTETHKAEDSSQVIENSLVFNSTENKIENMVVEEAVMNSSITVVSTLKKNDKLEKVEISSFEPNTEIFFTQNSLNDEEVNSSKKYDDIAETKKGQEYNVYDKEDGSLFDVKVPTNIHSKNVASKDNIIDRNDKVESTNNLVETNIITNNTDNKYDSDLKASLNYTDNTRVTDIGNNAMLTFGVEKDSKTHEETEITEKNNSNLENDTSTIIDISEYSKNSVLNNNRGATNMDLETAAITIQKVFRTFLFKSRASNDETSSIDEDIKEASGYSIQNLSNERRPLGITRMDTMLQTVNEEKSLSLSTDDSSTLSSAATIIQAHIRGFLVRNKLNSNKTASTSSVLNSEEPLASSVENDTNLKQINNKTVLNIHIVSDGNVPSLSQDESFITSMDLSLDGSPPSSINLHPLGYDKSEPRKQLKREDAVQSISPPSNNSGKLSEDVDSTKEIITNCAISDNCSYGDLTNGNDHSDKITTVPEIFIVQENLNKSLENNCKDGIADPDSGVKSKRSSLTKMSSDEMDVVTQHRQDENQCVPESSNTTKLRHSGELHDVVLPTNVSRGSTSVVRGE